MTSISIYCLEAVTRVALFFLHTALHKCDELSASKWL